MRVCVCCGGGGGGVWNNESTEKKKKKREKWYSIPVWRKIPQNQYIIIDKTIHVYFYLDNLFNESCDLFK